MGEDFSFRDSAFIQNMIYRRDEHFVRQDFAEPFQIPDVCKPLVSRRGLL